jgi:L-serine dehydratase
VVCSLYGSLGATGKGHGSDTAVLLGLSGHEPDTVDVELVPALLGQVRETRRIQLAGTHDIAFNERDDLLFFRRETLPFHTNGLRLQALSAAGAELTNRVFYSVGGGFVVSEEVAADGSKMKAIAPDATVLPRPVRSRNNLLALTQQYGCSVVDVMRTNERHWRTDEEIDSGLLNIWRVMQECVVRGCNTPGILPGGFR